MRFTTTYRWLNLAAPRILLFAVAAANVAWGGQPADVPEFSSIRDEWERTLFGRSKEGKQFPPPKPLVLTPEQKADRLARHAEQCLQLADKQPDTQAALAALYLAACRAPGLDAGKLALRRLSEKVTTSDLGEFELAVTSSRVDAFDAKHVFEEIAPVIIKRVKHDPTQPRAAALLTRICSVLGFDSQTAAAPPQFTDAADLITARYANSPDIFNFCETLGGMHFSPHWAGGFEKHLQTILAKSQDRWVRCTGSLARASIAELSLDRQAEAEKLYEQFLTDFDGKTKYQSQVVEQVLGTRAGQRLAAMRFAPIGRLTPEIAGVGLDGQPMKLSEYRGKVVLVSFWATWCGPCMKLIPHERELATRLADKPFAIVGVNGNTTEESIQKAITQYKITWRSFQDQRPGKGSISDEWNALYPTVFLIDHKGIFRKRWTGAPPIDVLNRMVDELVAEAADKQND